MDAVTSERLDQLTRISESSALADADQMTSERLDQMTSERLDQMTSERLDQMTSERLDQLSRMQQETGGATTEEWPDSGDDSDAELHVSDASSISIGSWLTYCRLTDIKRGASIELHTLQKL